MKKTEPQEVKQPIQQVEEPKHRMVRIKFQRFDQPENPAPIRLFTREIDFEKTLTPGEIYELPEPVVRFINSRAEPVYKEFRHPDGSVEMRIAGEKARFAAVMA